MKKGVLLLRPVNDSFRSHFLNNDFEVLHVQVHLNYLVLVSGLFVFDLHGISAPPSRPQQEQMRTPSPSDRHGSHDSGPRPSEEAPLSPKLPQQRSNMQTMNKVGAWVLTLLFRLARPPCHSNHPDFMDLVQQQGGCALAGANAGA